MALEQIVCEEIVPSGDVVRCGGGLQGEASWEGHGLPRRRVLCTEVAVVEDGAKEGELVCRAVLWLGGRSVEGGSVKGRRLRHRVFGLLE